MTQGRSIRLFLVDGTPNGLLSAEIMNWTGHVLTGPRSKLVQPPDKGAFSSPVSFLCCVLVKRMPFDIVFPKKQNIGKWGELWLSGILYTKKFGCQECLTRPKSKMSSLKVFFLIFG
ncbi:hypothetical protein [Halomonas sp. 11-S5]|uniref:hypothetical protein n=1 Tax=Halomonas sp. 11-S5 TaxID=2994064 RepID=UPI0024698535|nr:hypothetical protein [Halomonas sp. 11-S5]